MAKEYTQKVGHLFRCPGNQMTITNIDVAADQVVGTIALAAFATKRAADCFLNDYDFNELLATPDLIAAEVGLGTMTIKDITPGTWFIAIIKDNPDNTDFFIEILC